MTARAIPVLVGIGLLLCPAQAQKQTAHLTIQVNDMSGAVISKAHVEIVDVAATFTKKLEADTDGKLSIDVPFGTYEVTASYPAFKMEKKRIDVQDASQTVTFMLNVVGGSTVEVVPMPSGSESTYASLPDELPDESNVNNGFCSPCAGVPQSTMTVAQNKPGNRIQPSCGPNDIEFEVRTSKHQPDTPDDSGKAKIYVVEVIRRPFFQPDAPTIRVGLDGTWVGATYGSSYFAFSVDPGEHHVCTQWQSSLKSRERKAGFASFTAEAGKRYYFRVRITPHIGMELDRVDPDEGKFLVSSSALSVSHPKK